MQIGSVIAVFRCALVGMTQDKMLELDDESFFAISQVLMWIDYTKLDVMYHLVKWLDGDMYSWSRWAQNMDFLWAEMPGVDMIHQSRWSRSIKQALTEGWF